jgi:hypothetical protein
MIPKNLDNTEKEATNIAAALIVLVDFENIFLSI